MADEAVRIGPAPAESYLVGAPSWRRRARPGAEAIHPGYGFLSENAGFVEACRSCRADRLRRPVGAAIRAMGLKDAAKALMEKAGVPVVPGYHGDEQAPDFLKQKADEIGYPVLIKARGGRRRQGHAPVECKAASISRTALAGAQREGKASFGDPRVLVEKFVTAPRHIEMQVFGDNHGNAVHLFERDCSRSAATRR
jgi:3-methylcrotonyl-CoA carboxylase alpha subunit